MASWVSNALTEDKLAPSGKPTTVQILTFEPASFSLAKGIKKEWLSHHLQEQIILIITAILYYY